MVRHWLLSALVLCSLPLLTPAARAAEAAPATHPVLARLGQALSQLMETHLPQGGFTIAMEDGKLTARYHTRPFQVYSRYKSGRIAELPHEETGPDADGLLLEIAVQSGKTYRGQALLPQEFRGPYWTTFGDYRPLVNESAHLRMNLSYGNLTDQHLIASIEHLIACVASGQPFSDDVMVRRQQVLDAAVVQVKDGLRALAVQYPQLQQTAAGPLETALGNTRSTGDRVSIVVRSPRGKNASQAQAAEGGTFNLTLNIEDSWYHTTCYQLAATAHAQCPLHPMYPNLFLYGQVQASASDPALDTALKKLVQDALAPLAQLNEEVGAAKAKEQ